MLSRKRARTAIVMRSTGLLLWIISCILKSMWILFLGTGILLVALFLCHPRCPYCEKQKSSTRWGNRVHWSKPDEG